MLGTLNAMRKERAEKIRDVLYIRELSENELDDRISKADRILNGKADPIGYKGIAELANRISIDDGFKEKEIDRILNSDKDMTFDEMLGIK